MPKTLRRSNEATAISCLGFVGSEHLVAERLEGFLGVGRKSPALLGKLARRLRVKGFGHCALLNFLAMKGEPSVGHEPVRPSAIDASQRTSRSQAETHQVRNGARYWAAMVSSAG